LIEEVQQHEGVAVHDERDFFDDEKTEHFSSDEEKEVSETRGTTVHCVVRTGVPRYMREIKTKEARI